MDTELTKSEIETLNNLGVKELLKVLKSQSSKVKERNQSNFAQLLKLSTVLLLSLFDILG